MKDKEIGYALRDMHVLRDKVHSVINASRCIQQSEKTDLVSAYDKVYYALADAVRLSQLEMFPTRRKKRKEQKLDTLLDQIVMEFLKAD